MDAKGSSPASVSSPNDVSSPKVDFYGSKQLHAPSSGILRAWSPEQSREVQLLVSGSRAGDCGEGADGIEVQHSRNSAKSPNSFDSHKRKFDGNAIDEFHDRNRSRRRTSATCDGANQRPAINSEETTLALSKERSGSRVPSSGRNRPPLSPVPDGCFKTRSRSGAAGFKLPARRLDDPDTRGAVLQPLSSSRALLLNVPMTERRPDSERIEEVSQNRDGETVLGQVNYQSEDDDIQVLCDDGLVRGREGAGYQHRRGCSSSCESGSHQLEESRARKTR